MSHLSDKELDRLSREAAEQNDVEQNTSGWDRLHLRLNKEMPENQRKQRRSLLMLLSLFVLLTGSGLVYQYLTSPELPAADNPTTGINQDAPGIKNAHGNAGEKEITGKSNNTTNVTKQDDTKQPDHNSVKTGIQDKATIPVIPVNPPGGDKNTSAVTTATTSSISKSQKVNNNQPARNVGNSKKSREQTLSGRNTANRFDKNITGSAVVASEGKRKADVNTTRNKPNQSSNILNNDPEPSMVAMALASDVTTIRKPAIDRTNTLKQHTIAGSLPTANEKKNEQQQSDKKFPFSIAVVGGTDWSTVRFTHNDKAGYNAGITLSWHFAKNFSLTTGALYTKKNYTAYGNDYHPPKGYWTNYITLDEVNGSCWMIDIPLNVRYDFAGGKKYSFFGSTGFSTYLMNKESYTYHYMYNGSYNNRKWVNDKNSSHLFSILNFSAGYEKSVGKKVSVQIEPYLKLPVSGIGFGNMQMNSYGINFAIRYRPEFKKQNTTVPVINP